MNFIEQLIENDRSQRLASGVVAPVIFPVMVIIVLKMMEYSPLVLFLVCVGTALFGWFLHGLMRRLYLQKLSDKQQAVLGAIGWLASIPIMFLVAKVYLFK